MASYRDTFTFLIFTAFIPVLNNYKHEKKFYKPYTNTATDTTIFIIKHFLKNLEKQIRYKLQNKITTYYISYVNKILIIHKNKITPEIIANNFNKVHTLQS
jgi:hypothetical protein